MSSSWWWAETASLRLADDGTLHLVLRDPDGDYDGLRRLGPIELAEVPADVRDEYEHLLDLWRDAPSRRDVEREWESTYRRQQGF